MHQIYKTIEEVIRFNNWAKLQKLQLWSDFSAPQSEYHQIYQNVRNHIAIVEQSCISSYTEKPLGNDTHIDHFRKRSLYPHLTFDYSNFLVDDRNDNYGACFKDNRAGVTKSTFDGKERIFCPITENMSDFIEFLIDGAMVPRIGLTEHYSNRVKETIRVFNLNHKALKNQRSDIIKIIKEYRKFGLTNEDIRNSMEKSGFPTLINWILRNFE